LAQIATLALQPQFQSAEIQGGSPRPLDLSEWRPGGGRYEGVAPAAGSWLVPALGTGRCPQPPAARSFSPSVSIAARRRK
jgi:hypothetical protein